MLRWKGGQFESYGAKIGHKAVDFIFVQCKYKAI